MERKIIDYLPDVVRGYDEFAGIAAGQQVEFEKAWDKADSLLADQFILTAGESGISRWEKILGIVPKGTDTLDDRRFRVLTRLNEELPYTLPKLREMLSNLCGGKFTAELSDYTLSVKLGLSAKSNYSDVVTLLDRVIPANILAEVSLLYNKYSMLHPYTHAQLKLHTHEGLRTEEVFQSGE